MSMVKTSKRAAFTMLEEGKPRWRCFSSAFGLEFVVLMVLIWLPALMPQKLEVVRRYWMTPIAAPPVVPWKPQPKPIPVKQPIVARVVPKPEELVVPPKPKIISPVFTSPVARPATARRNTAAPEAPQVAAALPDVHPLSGGSSALPTLKRPRESVQTGGFGDPNGLPGNGRPDKAANIAHVGSYDLPPGPGYGNGTGGSKGARGVVASTGFGNGVAVGGNGGGGSGRGAVKQGGFADERPTTEAPKAHTAPAAAKTQPVVLLYKPKPAYTQEARQKRIEGEVLLQVAFSASGQVQVLRVMQGLGYGLDEAAVAAAQQIRFRAAIEDGQPVDSTAVVHILFELAY
jgi:TonB family protein